MEEIEGCLCSILGVLVLILIVLFIVAWVQSLGISVHVDW